ncbi:hypothetical protein, partial [uncultured Akkermansia sp.]|uniref:hypothetical protein n=1 Tax=uncultured Akkermansia sp. TaxID=512294 RepID=UPI00262F6A7D
EYGRSVNNPASFQRAAFRPRFILMQENGKFFLPIEGEQIFQNALRRYRHNNNSGVLAEEGNPHPVVFPEKLCQQNIFC